ncbi:SRPBCC domain-containing protein [Streptomyces sp. JW3]|uniref:SRPBCC domain-containing protein n=1 Tax=Streptomyces sp. JW3 TaxID=3456955 RepID=UPI003FA429DD
MEHEVFVPVVAERLREALADPARVAAAVPGLQQEAGAEPVTGRLKLRVGSHSVTYRGAVRVSARGDGTYAVQGDAGEARGPGRVTLALTVRVAGAAGGATLTFGGTVTAEADGRLTELPPDAVRAAATRLLTRFAENLGRGATAETSAPATAPEVPPTVFDTEVPESALGPEAAPAPDEGATADAPAEAADAPAEAADVPAEVTAEAAGDGPPAEAAHARRTMIGRSAEEVDHAPPRGRYAPVPAPQAASAATPLRWAAPAAALAVASAIVVGRALRRRR